MMSSYLNSINYLLDKKCIAGELDFLKRDPSKYEKYGKAGIKNHYKTDQSAAELAYWVLFHFLEEHPSAKHQIDMVIFTTDDLEHLNDINVVTVNSILNEVGLGHAFPIFQGYSNCANSCTSFHSACSLVESGRAQNVLVISVDKVGTKDSDYMMNPEMSVLSDAAICLWISSTPIKNALTVGSIFQKNNPAQWLIDRQNNYQLFTINKLKLYTSIAKQVNAELKAEFHHFVLNNYFRHIIEMFIALFKINPATVDLSNIARVGHAPAGDVFINLFDLMKNKNIPLGEKIVLVADSPSLCIGIILTKEH